jgi:hypothetical protein
MSGRLAASKFPEKPVNAVRDLARNAGKHAVKVLNP